jgi:hypothetical protein
MSPDQGPTPSRLHPSVAEWKQIVAPYEEPSVWRATAQIVETLGPYVLLCVLMVHSLAVSWWLTLALAALAGTLLMRVFIIFHDCGHGSFFCSRLANDVTSSSRQCDCRGRDLMSADEEGCVEANRREIGERQAVSLTLSRKSPICQTGSGRARGPASPSYYCRI